MAEILVAVSGDSSREFCDVLRENGIPFEDRTARPQPGTIYMSAGELFAVLRDNMPTGATASAAIATAFVAWMRRKASRKVTITTKDYKVVHTEGMSVDEVAKLLEVVSRVTLIDPSGEKQSE